MDSSTPSLSALLRQLGELERSVRCLHAGGGGDGAGAGGARQGRRHRRAASEGGGAACRSIAGCARQVRRLVARLG